MNPIDTVQMVTGLTKRLALELAVIAVALLQLSIQSEAATVTPETLRAWNGYVQLSKSELAGDFCDGERFLLIKELPAGVTKVHSGQILAVKSPHGALVSVPSGLVHHWIGAVFIPGAQTLDVLTGLQDYDSYADVYKPAVIESRLLSHKGDEFTYKLKFEEKGFGIKAGLIGEFRSNYYRVDRLTGYSITEAIKLEELDNSSGSEERSLPLSASHGYVERMFTIVRYQEADGGVYLEVETLTLSRDVPAAMRWLVSPVIQKFSRQVMVGTLEKLKTRVEQDASFESASRR
ncbi:MAG: hypothetical protein M3Y72_07600 [Acidobacteriota bacterium]|nr:hypothetical protein [Acidobacteriota bacterium]